LQQLGAVELVTLLRVSREQRADSPLHAWLKKQTWSRFAIQLATSYDIHGGFTPQEHAAAVRMRQREKAQRLRAVKRRKG